MLFTIVESFSPQNGDLWTNYCKWRGFNFTRFDSIDGILRPTLFNAPTKDEDWNYVVNEDFKLHLITDYEYAIKKRDELGKGDLVGLRFDEHDENNPGFLGFDLIDSYCDVSLLTNWGNDVEIINRSLSSSGLILSRQSTEDIRKELLRTSGDDMHIEACQIVSIYRPSSS